MKILTGISGAITLLLTGAMAGVFFAYSTSVMMGLDAIKPEQAIAAMRSINVKIQNAAFLPPFLLMPGPAGVRWIDRPSASGPSRPGLSSIARV